MKKTYQRPLIERITTITSEHMLEGGSVTVVVHTNEEYSGTAASNYTGHYSVWNDDEENEDDF